VIPLHSKEICNFVVYFLLNSNSLGSTGFDSKMKRTVSTSSIVLFARKSKSTKT